MKKKTYIIVSIVLIVIAVLSFIYFIIVVPYLNRRPKGHTFPTEVSLIYHTAQEDFIKVSETEGVVKNRVFCNGTGNPLKGPNGYIMGECPDGKLDYTTIKDYYVEIDSTGTITYIGVADKTKVFGSTSVIYPSQILSDDCKDANDPSVKGKFVLKSIADPGKVNTTME